MMADEVILSLRIKSNHEYGVFLNNIRTGDFVVSDELRKTKSPRFSELDHFGDLLSEALFSRNPLLTDSLRAVPFSVRLVLEFREGVEELLNLPWEYIRDPQSGQPFSLERTFVRRIGEGKELKPLDRRPLKVLVVISEPLTLPSFNARRFHDVIQREAQGHVDKGLLQLEFLGLPSTPDSPTKRLLQEDFDVIHFIGHGNVGLLAFENELGADVEVKAENLYPFFRGKKVRLVILTACYSGAIAGVDLVSGTATALVKAGIPSVFAMQLPLEIETAYHLVGDLYAALLGQPFDELVRSLRASRFFAERLQAPAQWGVPVFYLQDKGRDPFQGVSLGQGFLKAWPSASPSHFLPEKPELFVGRKELLVEVNGALNENRITVLQGESGMGKSFLALEVSHWHRDRGNFAGGIIWIDLQAGGSYDTVLERIGQALLGKTVSEDTLMNCLGQKPTLIILDSFETVKEDAKLAKFLNSLPQTARVLLTTVAYMEIGHTVHVWEMEKDDAVEFFLRRAEKVGWDGTGYEYIPEICDGLGYMPLSIELVAPQAASIPLVTLLEKVREGLNAIAAERPDLPERHQKAEAALRVSYNPLEPQEKVLFARMSVFPGDALHEIISQVTEIPDAVDILSPLHRKGLVRFEKGRYRLHSIVRRFALERLEKDFQKRERYEENFAKAFLGFALWGEKALETEESRTAIDMTKLELQNLLGAQGWFLQKGRCDQCLYLSGALHLLLGRAGLWRARILSSSLATKAAQNKGDKRNIAVSLRHLGVSYYDLGDLAEAEKHYKASLKTCKEIGDKGGISSIFHELGMIEFARANWDEAQEYFQKSLKIGKKTGIRTRTDRVNLAMELFQLGIIEFERGKLTKSAKYHGECLKISEQIDDKVGIAKALHELAFVEFRRGNLEKAEEYSKTGLKIKEEIGDRPGIAKSLSQLGNIEDARGKLNKAEEYYKDGLKIYEEIGDRFSIAGSFHQLGSIELRRGHLDKAEEYYKDSLGINEEIGNRLGGASSLSSLANLNEERGQFEIASKFYIIAASLFHEIGSPSEKIALGGIARMCKKLGEKKFQEMLKEVEEQGYPFS